MQISSGADFNVALAEKVHVEEAENVEVNEISRQSCPLGLPIIEDEDDGEEVELRRAKMKKGSPIKAAEVQGDYYRVSLSKLKLLQDIKVKPITSLKGILFGHFLWLCQILLLLQI